MKNYFPDYELACRHCGKNHMQPDFVEKMNHLRELCGFPLPVSSAYRCPTHNNKVSSTGTNGPHTTGRAVDFTVHGERAHTLLKHAVAMGFTGIGVKQTGPRESRFIHLDDLGAGFPRPTVWGY